MDENTTEDESLLPLSSHPPLKVMEAIYGRCRDDAIIALGSLRPGRNGDLAPRYLYPLPVRDRHEMLPTLYEYCLSQTQYICPNTLHQGARLGKPDEYFRAGLDLGHPRYFQAKNQHVYELCAITIDLDVGRDPDGIGPGLAFGVVMEMCLRHQMVWPSLVALSGRGCYLMFLLREEKSDRPPLNTDDNRACWKLITNELVQRLDHLEADPNAKRLANWYKAPGTVDFKTGNEVAYFTIGVDDLVNVPFYRLSKLMKTFGLVHAPEPRLIDVRPAPAKLPAPAPAKHLPPSGLGHDPRLREPIRKVQPGKGAEPYKRRAAEIELLSQHRHGIPEGLRSTTLFHYFQARRAYLAMTYKGEPDGVARAYQDAVDAAFRLNQTFRPPLPAVEVRKACTAKASCRMARSTTIATDLHVTDDEVKRLGLVSIVPPGLKNVMKTQEDRIKGKNRQYRERLQALVDGMIQEGKDTPEILATVEATLFKKIGRQYVYDRRKRIAQMNPPTWFPEGA